MITPNNAKILDYASILMNHLENDDLSYLWDKRLFNVKTLHFNLTKNEFQRKKTHETFLTINSTYKRTKELYIDSIVKKASTQVSKFTKEYLKSSDIVAMNKVSKKEWPVDYLTHPNLIIKFLVESISGDKFYISDYVSDIVKDVFNDPYYDLELSEKIKLLNFAPYDVCKNFYDDLYSDMVNNKTILSEKLFLINNNLKSSDIKIYIKTFEDNNMFYYILKFSQLSNKLSMSLRIDKTFYLKSYNKSNLKNMISDIQFDDISVSEILNFQSFKFTSMCCSSKTKDDINNFLKVYKNNLTKFEINYLNNIKINDDFKSKINSYNKLYDCVNRLGLST